ncbi:MAG: septum site-determining protein MinC [Pseudomonadota bacterium]|jgi:septum site-determining protein MinC
MQNSALHKPIDIKISTVVAISVVLHETDSAILAAAVHDMTGGASDFFDNEFAVIDIGSLDAGQMAKIDWPELIRMLKAVNLNPAAVRNGNEEINQGLAALGLSVDDSPKDRHVAASEVASHAQAANAAADAHIAPAALAETVAAPAPPPPAAPPAAAQPAAQDMISPVCNTLIIDTPVRAGQRIYARGADLIITAVVNNGAEVIADGSIHVYAPLRGRALAGASGNANARIFALSMEPELLSIAGMYRTFEDGFPPNQMHQLTQARLVGDRLDISPVPMPGKHG